MTFTMIPCWQTTCSRTFYTLNELSAHHLDAHEQPLPSPAEDPRWHVTGMWDAGRIVQRVTQEVKHD